MKRLSHRPANLCNPEVDIDLAFWGECLIGSEGVLGHTTHHLSDHESCINKPLQGSTVQMSSEEHWNNHQECLLLTETTFSIDAVKVRAGASWQSII